MIEKKLALDVEELADVNPFQIYGQFSEIDKKLTYQRIVDTYVNNLINPKKPKVTHYFRLDENNTERLGILHRVLSDLIDSKHVQLISGDIIDEKLPIAEFSSKENLLQVYSTEEGINGDYFIALFNKDDSLSEKSNLFYKVINH